MNRPVGMSPLFNFKTLNSGSRIAKMLTKTCLTSQMLHIIQIQAEINLPYLIEVHNILTDAEARIRRLEIPRDFNK